MERTFNPCDECPYGIDFRDGSGNDDMCKICEFRTITDGTADLIVRNNRLQAALAEAQQDKNRMTKAFALLCRVLDDFAGLSPCQIRQIDWPECNGESEQCGDRPLWQCWQKYILELVDAEQVCRVCGCTQGNACQGGCYWVEPDLCSACIAAAQAGKGEAE